MDYVLKPSLEHMALTKIAVAMWDQDDIRASMEEHRLPWNSFSYSRRLQERLKAWLEAGDKVIEKVPRLPLPERLKKKVSNFVSGIGCEMFKWIEYHHKFNLDIVLPTYLFWTPHGTVDTKKTAEAIIQKENIDVARRYRLACDYCLEDDIPKLWDKIPENLREEFDYEIEHEYLLSFWTCGIKEQVDKLVRVWGRGASLYRYAFEYVADHSNKTAVKYFWQKLTCEERKDWLVTIATSPELECDCSSYFPDVLCFLFSQMNEWEQTKIFKERPHNVLGCLLHWPWQSLFIETANRMWDFFSGADFCFLLEEIIYWVKEGYKDCDYQKLFGECWHQSPNAHKKYVIAKFKTVENFLLYDLFEMESEENVRLILNTATVEERKDIIFARNTNYIFEDLVDTNKWDSIKHFLQECLSSKEVMIEYKEKFKEHLAQDVLAAAGTDWDKFFRLLDDLIQENNNKRSAE